MPCAKIPQAGFGEFRRVMDEKAMSLRLPYLGSLALTYRCNQDCVHCYCSIPAEDRAARDQELSLDEVRRILDEVADAGCLWLLLTGGEPLLRPDFRDIYLHAIRRGMFIEVFTNGTLLTPELADLFADYPPLGVEITIYGATAATHDRITRSPGSLDRSLAAAGLLKERGVDVALKTMVMSLNKHELTAMRGTAEAVHPGRSLAYDTILVPRLDEGFDNRGLRLSPEETVALDLADEKSKQEYGELLRELSQVPARDLLLCGAGAIVFTINPYGMLQPCDSFPNLAYDIRKGSFSAGWREAMPLFRRVMEESLSPKCLACDKAPLCEQCSGYAMLEHRSLGGIVEPLCRKAGLRHQALAGKKAGSKEPAQTQQ
ncbi:MAG: radical SAM protein [Elusimicrobia bacterium]|nr:radical SAM protein [Elusimicrobiota bacterium]